jgi:hypothetical protein
MPESSSKTKNKSAHPLIGTWVSVDVLDEDVEYIISRHGKAFSVRAVDRSDNDEADVYDVKWDKEKSVLSFATHWNSTGRFVRCRLMVQAADQIDFTYTYTAKDILKRKSKRVR